MAILKSKKNRLPGASLRKSLPADDAKTADRLGQIDRWTHILDESFQIPGTNIRLGWDSLIGLIPGVGDLATSGLSAYLIFQAHKAGASKWILARMLGNVGLDFVIGAIPLIGDTFDVFFKSNRRNARLLKKHLRKSG